MVKNKREKNKIGKKERKYVYVQLANLAKVIKEDTHQMAFEQISQRIKWTHSVDIWRKNFLGRRKSKCEGAEASVYFLWWQNSKEAGMAM